LTLLVENFLFPESFSKIFLIQGKTINGPQTKKKIKLRTKNNGTGRVFLILIQIFNCAHAQDQICQTTLKMEEKFSVHAADEDIEVWTRI